MQEFNFIGLIIFTVIILITPGPAVISTLYSGINYGYKKSFPYILGMVSGYCINLSLGVLGLGLIVKNAQLYIGFKYLMFAYIFYLAYKIAFSSALKEGHTSKPLGFFKGVLLNVLNPKAYVAALSSISQFSLANAYSETVAYIVVVNLIVAFTSQNLWCLLGQGIKKFFTHPRWYKYINILLALLLISSVLCAYIQ